MAHPLLRSSGWRPGKRAGGPGLTLVVRTPEGSARGLSASYIGLVQRILVCQASSRKLHTHPHPSRRSLHPISHVGPSTHSLHLPGFHLIHGTAVSPHHLLLLLLEKLDCTSVRPIRHGVRPVREVDARLVPSHVKQASANSDFNIDMAETIEPVEWADADDCDSGYDEELMSTASVTSSIFAYQEENGRTYHAYRAGKYVIPNDEGEQERMDRKSATLFHLSTT